MPKSCSVVLRSSSRACLESPSTRSQRRCSSSPLKKRVPLLRRSSAARISRRKTLLLRSSGTQLSDIDLFQRPAKRPSSRPVDRPAWGSAGKSTYHPPRPCGESRTVLPPVRSHDLLWCGRVPEWGISRRYHFLELFDDYSIIRLFAASADARYRRGKDGDSRHTAQGSRATRSATPGGLPGLP